MIMRKAMLPKICNPNPTATLFGKLGKNFRGERVGRQWDMYLISSEQCS